MRTKLFVSFVIVMTLFLFAGCSWEEDNDPDVPDESFVFDLNEDMSWIGGFADYSDANCASDNCNMQSEYRRLPIGLDVDGQGYYLQSDNHSDDMFMFIKRRIDGLFPNTTYEASFIVFIASPMCAGLSGVGGAPGEANYFHAGGSTIEPEADPESPLHRMNINKGNQANSGEATIVIGNLAVECESLDLTLFYQKTLISEETIEITTDENGSLWVIVGNDSGFEGITGFYILEVEVDFAPI
jgi:hypothetical protein